MLRSFAAVWGLLLMSTAAFSAEAPESRLFEMRTYYSPSGKLDQLHARFRDHTMKLFEKHGMTNIGYWVPLDNTDNKLIYLLAYPDREAREESWKAFLADPDWQKAQRESEAGGRLVEKIETRFLHATDYSPSIEPSDDTSRIFELRTYTATPGNLSALNARFREHTMRLFEKHGITNIGYWTPLAGEQGADDTLIYLIAHQSEEAAKKSWDAFRQDPEWTAARRTSEENAGGSLTAKDGVKSLYLKATDYSPIR